MYFGAKITSPVLKERDPLLSLAGLVYICCGKGTGKGRILWKRGIKAQAGKEEYRLKHLPEPADRRKKHGGTRILKKKLRQILPLKI